MGVRDAALGGDAERAMSSTAGPGTPIDTGLFPRPPLERAGRRQLLVASLEVDQQDAHHARLCDAVRVGPQPPMWRALRAATALTACVAAASSARSAAY